LWLPFFTFLTCLALPPPTLFPYTTLFRSLAGTSTLAAGGVEIAAGGLDIGGASDEFHFFYQTCSNDFDVAIRVESLANSDVWARSEEHTSELQSRFELVCRLLLEKKNVWS